MSRKAEGANSPAPSRAKRTAEPAKPKAAADKPRKIRRKARLPPRLKPPSDIASPTPICWSAR